MDDNKIHYVQKPEDDKEMFEKFEGVINQINSFSFDRFKQSNALKCEMCIYEPLYSFSLINGGVKSVYRT